MQSISEIDETRESSPAQRSIARALEESKKNATFDQNTGKQK